MALDPIRLGDAMKTVFIASGAADNPATAALCAGLAAAIVTEFTTNGEVDPLGTPPLNAPPGGGPVTGRGKIT